MPICSVRNPSRRDVLIRFREPSVEPNAIGEVDVHVTTTEDTLQAWGTVRSKSSKEVYFQNQTHGQADVIVECDYSTELAEVESSWQMVIAGDVYELIGKPENVDYSNSEFRFVGRATEGM